MKRWIVLLFWFCLFIVLTACSSNDHSNEAMDTAGEEAEGSSETTKDMAYSTNNSVETNQAEDVEEEASEIPEATDRKVIYTAYLSLEVTSFTNAVQHAQDKIEETGGYIVESNTYGSPDDEYVEGTITARIPQDQFQGFMDVMEDGSVKVIERNISGSDVTEEFVDLESRLSSKEVVEQRLLSFMEQAENTEDLLKISDDLAKVQEEIEEISGRLNYLTNKTDYATVTIHMYENRVNIPKVKDDDLNTWQKTKQQFVESINFLLAAGSGFFIFFIGNLPIFFLIILLGFVIYRYTKKKKGNS